MKRGESGLSLLVAVDKPYGMSSHDVVNRVRGIFAERRVGHTGTLDPMATGVLPVCVGPATRLDKYMTGHDKRYRVGISFGCETTTDDAEGEPTVTANPSQRLYDEGFARDFLHSLLGGHMQVPPQYSAVKIDGKRAYKMARSGDDVVLEPRPIQVYEANLVSLDIDEETGNPCWSVDFSVSKGTYIRALARDIGRSAGCPAHVGALQRLTAGAIELEDCVSLESLEDLGAEAALDPIAVLGFRFAFCDSIAKKVDSGGKLKVSDVELYEPLSVARDESICACTSRLVKSDEPLRASELVSIIVENRLKALYTFDEQRRCLVPSCVFSTGVFRG